MTEFVPVLFIVFGLFIGVFGVLFGGSMFLSVPIFQMFFPGASSFGAIVGSIKIGSASRGLFTVLSTWRHIDWRMIIRCWPVLLGSVVGAMTVSHVSLAATVPILLLAILVAANPRRLSALILRSNQSALLLSLLVGVYAGFFGAGISMLLLALVRITNPEKYADDHQIMLSNIQVRFLEFVTACIAVIGHIAAGSVTLSNMQMWLWWGIGAAAGGLIGGILLSRFQSISPKLQKLFLFVSFAFAVGTAISIQFGR